MKGMTTPQMTSTQTVAKRPEPGKLKSTRDCSMYAVSARKMDAVIPAAIKTPFAPASA